MTCDEILDSLKSKQVSSYNLTSNLGMYKKINVQFIVNGL